ncbi:aspartate aminotransferase family protein [Effusibacillus lacus]|uniref:Acetylornithine aminotransferase n=1 Tax=Effusibacillus lacus TaxID=1348429 RepID=A0A292YNT1_9BACL|nr:aspartate aminotransferase family protein [Effusibacillus lacus]TCS74155.1 acetylornithine aminotransferase [Effusibacillus lacus]GAX90846.1 aspartate aminotransferase family protein [Effusibacillus lacus]
MSKLNDNGTNGVANHVMQTYGRWPVAMVKGEGVWLYDDKGKQYLDFTAGIAVTGLGHAHPKIAEVIARQASTLLHCSNLFHIPSQMELAGKLVELSCCDQVFFCNSGAEAIEGSIKMARRYAHKNYGPEKHEIITFEHSFHGRTLGALTATCQQKYQEGFAPLVPGFHYAQSGDLESVKSFLSPEKTCAVLLEPVQGEGGVRPFDKQFLMNLRKLCDENGVLLIFDEVQTGVGRTGTFFAYEQLGVEPDIIALAKGLANGVPIGAVLAKQHVADVMVPGTHASTFGGNPLATAAGVATVEILLQEGILAHVREMGAYLVDKLQTLVGKYFVAQEVRGMGLLVGLSLDRPAGDVIKACLEKGLLLTVAGGNAVRFTPPLIVEKEHIDQAVSIVEQTLVELYQPV